MSVENNVSKRSCHLSIGGHVDVTMMSCHLSIRDNVTKRSCHLSVRRHVICQLDVMSFVS